MTRQPSEFIEFDAEESRNLRRVRVFAQPDLPNWPGVIEFGFDEFIVFVCAEPEFDTLLCTRMIPERFRRSHTVPLASTFWNGVLGWALTDAWRMTNDRGYFDALQLRFRERPNAGPYRYVQLFAICSSIQLIEFQVLREEPAPGEPVAP